MKYLGVPIGFLLCAFGTGCGSQNTVAAVVNGQVITAGQVGQRMERLNPATRAALGGDKRRLVEEMVMEKLLLQEARRRGVDRDKEVERLFEEAKRQILIGRLIEVLRQSQKVEVTETQVSQFYKTNHALFKEPESVRASHILVNSEEEAKKVLGRLKNGEPFAKVAQEVSVDPTKSRGGDVGYFSKGQLIPEFEKTCENLKVGQTSDPVKTALGFHVILLTDRRPDRERSLEETKEQIRRQLTAQGQQRQVEAVVQELRSKAQVTIREPFAQPAAPAASSAPAAPSS